MCVCVFVPTTAVVGTRATTVCVSTFVVGMDKDHVLFRGTQWPRCNNKHTTKRYIYIFLSFDVLRYNVVLLISNVTQKKEPFRSRVCLHKRRQLPPPLVSPPATAITQRCKQSLLVLHVGRLRQNRLFSCHDLSFTRFWLLAVTSTTVQ